MGSQVEHYHAAYVPWEVRKNVSSFNANEYVSSDKDCILSIMKCGTKNHKGYRFKSFTTLQEALYFVTDDSIDRPKTKPSENSAVESVLPFASLDIRDINAFKRSIESGNYDLVESYVARNPRFLISYNSDTPVILKSGPRYNAVHLAVRAKAADILKLILETIESVQFMRKCYPESDDDLIEEKRKHLLDLYLNTPDKVCFNTPLHFGCENGSLQCLRVLLSYAPYCDTSKRNKRGLTPLQVIRNPELSATINELFESCLYVTISRDEASFKVLEPVYGKPSLDASLQANKSGSNTMITAIAGPMSPQNARLVFEHLKSPKKNTDSQRKLRRSDFNRGLERVAKEVCHMIKVPIEEYWPFMKQYANLSTLEGLAKLNLHLQNMHDGTQVSRLQKDFGNLNLNGDLQGGDAADSDDDSVYYTPPSSPHDHGDGDNHDNRDNRDNHDNRDTLFYVGGSEPSRADHDVLAEVETSLSQQLVSLTAIRDKCPFVYEWYTKCMPELCK